MDPDILGAEPMHIAIRELNPHTFPEYSYLRKGKSIPCLHRCCFLVDHLLLAPDDHGPNVYICTHLCACVYIFFMQEYEAGCSPVQWEFTSSLWETLALYSASPH